MGSVLFHRAFTFSIEGSGWLPVCLLARLTDSLSLSLKLNFKSTTGLETVSFTVVIKWTTNYKHEQKCQSSTRWEWIFRWDRHRKRMNQLYAQVRWILTIIFHLEKREKQASWMRMYVWIMYGTYDEQSQKYKWGPSNKRVCDTRCKVRERESDREKNHVFDCLLSFT